MTVEQFVMAYGAEQDRLRSLLPEEVERTGADGGQPVHYFLISVE